jgi:hypothetical protein
MRPKENAGLGPAFFVSVVIASEVKQSLLQRALHDGLLRRLRSSQ